MTRNKPRARNEPARDIDLTPMIDIVFNLIIFFMIVSELSNLAIEDIQLAYADAAQTPPKEPSERTLQINVMERDGLIKVKGLAYTTDAQLISKKKLPSLKAFLEIEAAGYEREAPDADSAGGLPPSKIRVNIRADKEGRFQRVQEVFDACMHNGCVYTSLAASKDTPGN